MQGDDLEMVRQLREAQRKSKVERVRHLAQADELSTRETARRLGLSKNTVTKYKRMAGVTQPPPVRHVGGGRWVPEGGGDGR